MESAAVEALNDLANKNSEEFFKAVTSALTSAVSQHFERRLKEETDALRQTYETTLESERRCFQSQLQSLGQSLGESEATSEESAEAFRDAAQMNNDLTRYLRKEAASECPYSPAIALMLQELLGSAQLLNDHCKSRLSTMTATFCPRGLTGKEYPLQVRPTEETVKDVKQKIRAEYCKTCEVKLCCTSDGHLEMEDSQLLMHYNLDQEFTVILVDVLHSNELAHLSFGDPKNLAFDSVTQTSGTVLNSQNVEAIDMLGKRGVNVTDDGCLLLPKPVTISESGWTMSCWILAPINASRNRHLLDGNRAEELLCVALSRGKLRNFAEGNYLRGFNISQLPEGWHHLAIVGHSHVTTYYMDGKLLGHKYGVSVGQIASVANSRGQRNAWGYLADFHLFGMAADRLQIEGLYIAGGGSPNEEAESWQDAIVRQNEAEADSDSMSSYSSLQSYMDSDFSDAG